MELTKTIALLLTMAPSVAAQLDWTRIVGGDPVDPPNRYPYFTIVRGVDRNLVPDNRFCGGTLIYPDIVLAAASCIDTNPATGTYLLRTYTNVTNLGQIDSLPNTVFQRTSNNFIRHPDFFMGSFGDTFNDLVLIKLDSPINEVEPVSLNTHERSPGVGSSPVAIGLGASDGTGTQPVTLQEVDLQVLDADYCNQEPPLFDGALEDEVQICAGTGGDGLCFDDFGGPLVTLGENAQQDVQVGIGAYGFCGQMGLPSVFSRVSTFENFIEQGICMLTSFPSPVCNSRSPVVEDGNPVVRPPGSGGGGRPGGGGGGRPGGGGGGGGKGSMGMGHGGKGGKGGKGGSKGYGGGGYDDGYDNGYGKGYGGDGGYDDGYDNGNGKGYGGDGGYDDGYDNGNGKGYGGDGGYGVGYDSESSDDYHYHSGKKGGKKGWGRNHRNRRHLKNNGVRGA